MNRRRPNKRRALNLNINQPLQFHMIKRLLMVLILSLFCCSAVYYGFADQQISASFSMFHVRAQTFLDFLLPVVIGAFGCSLAIGFFASLFFPKSIAGSLFRIEQDLQEVLHGDLTKEITLRRGDENRALAELLNKVIRNQHEQVAHIRQTLARAQALEGEGDRLVTEVRLEEIQTIHRQLLEDLSNWKLAGGDG